MSIQRDPRKPLYEQIADAFRAEINAGNLRPGSRLPSETVLAGTYRVGRDTIRDAMQLLRNEGLIDWRRGLRSRVHESVDRIALTLQPNEMVIARMPTLDEAERLGLPEGEPVLELHSNGQVECYAASRTKVRGRSPEDWSQLP